MITLAESIENAAKKLDVYQRVHIELDQGARWGEIDIGLRDKHTYETWLAYMQQSLIIGLAEIVLISRRGQ